MCHAFELYFLFAIRELSRIGGERGLDKIPPELGNGWFLSISHVSKGARRGAPGNYDFSWASCFFTSAASL
jgi:hypothetical protein